MDNPLMTAVNSNLEKTLDNLRNVAVATNHEYADLLGIPQSAAITCVKPSGTVSQLVDSASGIHARHSPYYIRTVRGDNKDPLTQFMIDQKVPNEPCVFKSDTTTVFSFPVKSPENATTRNDMTAIEQLETWLTYQRHWCEHKPSVTISVVMTNGLMWEHSFINTLMKCQVCLFYHTQIIPISKLHIKTVVSMTMNIYYHVCQKRLTGTNFQSMKKKTTLCPVKRLLALVMCVKS